MRKLDLRPERAHVHPGELLADETAFEAGVDDYLNKDVDLLNLPNRVKLILEMG